MTLTVGLVIVRKPHNADTHGIPHSHPRCGNPYQQDSEQSGSWRVSQTPGTRHPRSQPVHHSPRKKGRSLMARTTHRFTQITDDSPRRQNYLYSIRQKKEIIPHEQRTHRRLTVYAWYLLPGPYFIHNYNRITQEWTTRLLVIKDDIETGLQEDYRPVNVPPPWLTQEIERTAA